MGESVRTVHSHGVLEKRVDLVSEVRRVERPALLEARLYVGVVRERGEDGGALWDSARVVVLIEEAGDGRGGTGFAGFVQPDGGRLEDGPAVLPVARTDQGVERSTSDDRCVDVVAGERNVALDLFGDLCRPQSARECTRKLMHLGALLSRILVVLLELRSAGEEGPCVCLDARADAGASTSSATAALWVHHRVPADSPPQRARRPSTPGHHRPDLSLCRKIRDHLVITGLLPSP